MPETPLRRHLHSAVVALPIALGGAGLTVGYGMLLATLQVPVTVASLLAVLLAATVSSVAGFAFSAICGAMLVHLIAGPVRVVEVMMVCSIAIQAMTVMLLWRGILWPRVTPFLLGGMLGLPIGIGLLLHLPQAAFRMVFGALIVVYSIYTALQKPMILRAPSWSDGVVGVLGGITGGLAAFPGACVTIWCSMKGWSKNEQRSVYQPVILVLQIMALAIIESIHHPNVASENVGPEVLAFIPPALLGTGFGLRVFKSLSDRSFDFVVKMLLLVSGLGLLV